MLFIVAFILKLSCRLLFSVNIYKQKLGKFKCKFKYFKMNFITNISYIFAILV